MLFLPIDKKPHRANWLATVSLHERGFTLIELLLVISIIAILSTIGIASFVSFSRTQLLNSAVSQVQITLETAKSRAFTQVKPNITPCNSNANPIRDYTVRILTTTQYQMSITCGAGAVLSEAQTLPVGVTFATTSVGNIIRFKPLTGEAQFTSPTITINGNNGGSKTITIDAAGTMTVTGN